MYVCMYVTITAMTGRRRMCMFYDVGMCVSIYVCMYVCMYVTVRAMTGMEVVGVCMFYDVGMCVSIYDSMYARAMLVCLVGRRNSRISKYVRIHISMHVGMLVCMYDATTTSVLLMSARVRTKYLLQHAHTHTPKRTNTNSP
jgi:hypothetical protein